MTLRMYAASSSPRLSHHLLADGVELLPSSSMSSADRWAIGFVGLLLQIVVMVGSFGSSGVELGQWSMSQAPAAALTQVWIRTPSPGRGGGDLAVAQVAHGALAQRQDAAEADAHPAAATA